MKGFLFGLVLGFTAGLVTQAMMEKNRDKMPETLEKLKSNSQDTLDKMMRRKQHLEDLLKKKTEEVVESRTAENQPNPLDIDAFDGSTFKDVKRYSLSRPDAAGVILENSTTGKIVLVEQFRYASASHPKSTGWTLEIVAGVLDFSSVGISDELTQLYYSTISPDKRLDHGGALLDDTEEDLETIMEKIRTGEIIDGKTIIACQWLALKRGGAA